MKREQATREYLNLSKNDSLVAAVDAYEWVESHPEEAPFMLRSLLFDLHTADVERNQELVSKAVSSYISKRVDEVRSVISKAAISKAANGEDIHSYEVLHDALELISKKKNKKKKKKGRDQDNYDRDKFGRFATHDSRIQTNPNVPPIPNETQHGIPHAANLNSRQRSQYQQAYMQVGDLLRSSGHGDNALVFAVDKNGNQGEMMTVGDARAAHANVVDPNNGLVQADAFKSGGIDKIYFVDHGAREHTPVTMGYDLLGSGRAGTVFGAATERGAFKNYNDTLIGDKTYPEPGTGEAFYRRLEAGSKLAEELGDPYLGDKTKAALKAANLAGKHAPEAEKVLGPKARKASYRYRGVEKTPHKRLQEHINEQRMLQRTKALEAGYSTAQADTIARNFIIDGEADKLVPSRPGDPNSPMQKVRGKESPVISYFKDRLPDKDLYELNRKSGTIPPSQGIIIDRKGKVVTEAMGYGDDWYLPFNLKNLSKLQGGEYIRTRAYGGLTSEDIYTGLVSGARSVTVVSHSGVYTVEFDDDFRGSRRYSDKSARMINRYEHLLDSLSSGKVTTAQTSPARLQEINDAAALEADPVEDQTGYENAVRRLLRQEQFDPQLAEADVENIKHEAADKAAIKAGYNNSEAYAEERMLTLKSEAKQAISRNPEAREEILENTDKQLSRLSSADGVLESLHVDPEALIERKQEEYKMAHRPLSLNARGYEKAQNALKEQFPYYFSEVKYRPWADSETTGSDKGYVKPKYNRPAGVAAGYWASSVNGVKNTDKDSEFYDTGKYRGDRTGYQNYAARERLAGKKPSISDQPDTGIEEDDSPEKKLRSDPSGAGSGSSSSSSNIPSGLTLDEQKTEAYMAAALELQRMYNNEKFDFSREDGTIDERKEFYDGQANGVPIATVIAEYKARPQLSNPIKSGMALFDVQNPDVLSGMLNKPETRGKVFSQVDELINSGLFKVRKDIVDNLSAAKIGQLGKPKEVSRNQTLAVKAYLDPSNANAKWNFPNLAANDGELKKAAPTIAAVSHYDSDEIKALDIAINKSNSEYKEMLSALNSGLTYGDLVRGGGVKSYALSDNGIPIVDRNGNVTAQFHRQVENLVRARQALRNKRMAKELKDKLKNKNNNGPGMGFNTPDPNQPSPGGGNGGSTTTTPQTTASPGSSSSNVIQFNLKKVN